MRETLSSAAELMLRVVAEHSVNRLGVLKIMRGDLEELVATQSKSLRESALGLRDLQQAVIADRSSFDESRACLAAVEAAIERFESPFRSKSEDGGHDQDDDLADESPPKKAVLQPLPLGDGTAQQDSGNE